MPYFKIAKLDGCNLVDTGMRTVGRYYNMESYAIEINDGEQGFYLHSFSCNSVFSIDLF